MDSALRQAERSGDRLVVRQLAARAGLLCSSCSEEPGHVRDGCGDDRLCDGCHVAALEHGSWSVDE